MTDTERKADMAAGHELDLPWLINGSLSEDEAKRVEDKINAGEIDPEDLALTRALAATVGQAEPMDEAQAAQALVAMNKRLDAELADDAVEVRQPASTNGWMAFWRQSITGLRLQGAMAAIALFTAFHVAGLLPATTAVDPNQPPTFQTRSVGSVGATADVQINIIFEQAATEQQIRRLLLEHRLTLVDGPSRHGIYTVSTPSDEAGAADLMAVLDVDPIVRFVARNGS